MLSDEWASIAKPAERVTLWDGCCRTDGQHNGETTGNVDEVRRDMQQTECLVCS